MWTTRGTPRVSTRAATQPTAKLCRRLDETDLARRVGRRCLGRRRMARRRPQFQRTVVVLVELLIVQPLDPRITGVVARVVAAIDVAVRRARVRRDPVFGENANAGAAAIARARNSVRVFIATASWFILRRNAMHGATVATFRSISAAPRRAGSGRQRGSHAGTLGRPAALHAGARGAGPRRQRTADGRASRLPGSACRRARCGARRARRRGTAGGAECGGTGEHRSAQRGGGSTHLSAAARSRHADCAMRIVRYCPPRRSPCCSWCATGCPPLPCNATRRRCCPPSSPHCGARGTTVAPIVVAEQGRVALGDDIGEAMDAEAVAVLIGERPGLSAADSLGVYLTWQPRRGRTDAERNCISNIRPEGLAPTAAANKLLWLIGAMRRLRLTGVGLKDEQPARRRTLPSAPVDETRMDAGCCPKIRLQTDLNRADQGSTVMQDSPDAGLSRFRRRGNRGADVPPGDGGSLVRNWLGSSRPVPHHAGAAIWRSRDCQPVLLGRTVRRRVRSSDATLHPGRCGCAA